VFYRGNFTIDDFIVRLSKKLTMANDLRVLLRRASVDIADVLKLEQAFFIVRYGEDSSMSSGTPDHKRLSRADVEKLDEYMRTNEEELLLADMLLSDEGVIKDMLE